MARVAGEEQNGPGLWKFAGESGSDSTKIIAYWGLCLNVAGHDSRVEVAGPGAGKGRGCG